jgi:hypothetical protein
MSRNGAVRVLLTTLAVLLVFVTVPAIPASTLIPTTTTVTVTPHPTLVGYTTATPSISRADGPIT